MNGEGLFFVFVLYNACAIFLAQKCFFIGIDILRGVKMWESEGFVNVGSISRFCECDLL